VYVVKLRRLSENAKGMITFNDKECLETKQGNYTKTQRSKLKQVYCFIVRQVNKQTKV